MTILFVSRAASRERTMACRFRVAFGGVRAEATLYEILARWRPDAPHNAFATESAATRPGRRIVPVRSPGDLGCNS